MKTSKVITSIILVLTLLSAVFSFSNTLAAGGPVVRAVLFFSPSCPHCHTVINEVLPPVQEKFQSGLQVFQIDVTQEIGRKIYQAAIQKFQLPDDRIGVPTMIIGDIVLVGSKEIPEQLPALIEQKLAAGGVGWPAIPGLAELAGEALPASSSNESLPAASQGSPALFSKFANDPTGNTLAVIALVIMLAAVIGVLVYFLQDPKENEKTLPAWIIPALSILGLGVALYLSYVEITQTKAICGPVGNCNAVQQSPYARLLGILPVGVMGAMGYLAILFAWLVQRYGPANLRRLAVLSIWGMAWFGILFSIYLTFLEPFVIGATCIWCLSSAMIMTVMLVVSTQPAKAALGSDQLAIEADPA